MAGAMPPPKQMLDSVLSHCTLSLLGVPLHPVLHVLLKLLAVLLVLVRDGGLDGVVRVRLDQERLDEPQHGNHLVRRFPLVGPEQAQAHGPLVVVADIGVVDLGLEADDGRLEGVFVGEINLELEVAALIRSAAVLEIACTVDIPHRPTDRGRPAGPPT